MNISHFKMLKAGGFLVGVGFLLVFFGGGVFFCCFGFFGVFCFVLVGGFCLGFFRWESIIILYTDLNTVHFSGWNDFQTGEKKWYLYLLSLDPMLMRSSESTLWTIAALYPALCAFKTCKPYKILIRKTTASKHTNLSVLSKTRYTFRKLIDISTTFALIKQVSPFKIKSYNYSYTHVIMLFFQKNNLILSADKQFLHILKTGLKISMGV